ncbi:hypothetical protein EU537_00980 [Candidatus Thorarchaeota archaeon]|nr:MAG: hypothetical protein EU537_00980 [Candidatus Thorarchaeota archaeon]
MSKGTPSTAESMPADRYWLLIITTIICIALAFVGVFFYPLNMQPISYLVAYEVSTILFILGIMKLIYERGPPHEVIQSRD